MTVEEIKKEISENKHCEEFRIKCKNCKYWGYNNGKVKNSYGDSKCLLLKKEVYGLSFCRNFAEKVDK